MVEVLYFADFKTITDKEKEQFNLSNNRSLMELISQLIEKYPSFEKILLDQNEKKLKSSISIAINHSIIDKNDIRNLKLNQDDKIAFLLPVSGG